MSALAGKVRRPHIEAADVVLYSGSVQDDSQVRPTVPATKK